MSEAWWRVGLANALLAVLLAGGMSAFITGDYYQDTSRSELRSRLERNSLVRDIILGVRGVGGQRNQFTSEGYIWRDVSGETVFLHTSDGHEMRVEPSTEITTAHWEALRHIGFSESELKVEFGLHPDEVSDLRIGEHTAVRLRAMGLGVVIVAFAALVSLRLIKGREKEAKQPKASLAVLWSLGAGLMTGGVVGLVSGSIYGATGGYGANPWVDSPIVQVGPILGALEGAIGGAALGLLTLPAITLLALALGKTLRNTRFWVLVMSTCLSIVLAYYVQRSDDMPQNILRTMAVGALWGASVGLAGARVMPERKRPEAKHYTRNRSCRLRPLRPGVGVGNPLFGEIRRPALRPCVPGWFPHCTRLSLPAGIAYPEVA